jgi:hypothetical protein
MLRNPSAAIAGRQCYMVGHRHHCYNPPPPLLQSSAAVATILRRCCYKIGWSMLQGQARRPLLPQPWRELRDRRWWCYNRQRRRDCKQRQLLYYQWEVVVLLQTGAGYPRFTRQVEASGGSGVAGGGAASQSESPALLHTGFIGAARSLDCSLRAHGVERRESIGVFFTGDR